MAETRKLSFWGPEQQEKYAHAEVYDQEEVPYYSIGWAVTANIQELFEHIVAHIPGEQDVLSSTQSSIRTNDVFDEGLIIRPWQGGGATRVEHAGLPEPLTVDGLLEIVEQSGIPLEMIRALRLNTASGGVEMRPSEYVTIISNIPVSQWESLISATIDTSKMPVALKESLVWFVDYVMNLNKEQQ